MRERLGKIAQLSFRTRIVLLGQKANVVAQREQPFEKVSCIVAAADQVEAICQPKRAEKKNAFRSGQTIYIVRLRSIAQDETVFH